MNTTDLLAATFAEHEADAPDVTETRLRIEAGLAGPSRRRPLVLAGVAAVAAAVVAVAVAPTVLDGGSGPQRSTPSLSAGRHPRATHSSSAPVALVDSFPFRPGRLPPGATFDHSEIGRSRYRLQDYVFGSVPSNVRGLTLWSDRGPLPTHLRDGGVLRSTTIAGRPAVEGWSPSSRSFTIAIRRPHGTVVTVLAYGWDRKITTSYAHLTARHLRYGDFARPN